MEVSEVFVNALQLRLPWAPEVLLSQSGFVESNLEFLSLMALDQLLDYVEGHH